MSCTKWTQTGVSDPTGRGRRRPHDGSRWGSLTPQLLFSLRHCDSLSAAQNAARAARESDGTSF